MREFVELIRDGDVAGLERALTETPSLATKPRVVVDAARVGDLATLKLLDRHGADWNHPWRGYRPLHALIQERPHGAKSGAVSPERLEALRFLLGRGADPALLGAFPPASALIIAAFAGEPAFVETLLERPAKLDAFAASALGDHLRVRRLLKSDASLASSRAPGGLTALQCCAGSRLGKAVPSVGRRLLQVAQILLEAGADPNAKTMAWDREVDVQYFAISAANVELVHLLFDAGADPTEAFPTAAWQTDMGLAEIAIERGARIDAIHDERPVLNELIRWGQLRQAMWLLEHGADPNIPDKRGWTAVHQAASRGNARIYRALLDRGGDPDRKDAAGMSVIDVARDTGNAQKLGIRRAAPKAL
jgi:ankyrin repeat protein